MPFGFCTNLDENKIIHSKWEEMTYALNKYKSQKRAGGIL